MDVRDADGSWFLGSDPRKATGEASMAMARLALTAFLGLEPGIQKMDVRDADGSWFLGSDPSKATGEASMAMARLAFYCFPRP
jgi:hypothetical protein